MVSRKTVTGTNRTTAAHWNRALALRLLRVHGALSRRQLSRLTGLRDSTLTYIVRELTDKRLIRPVGKRAPDDDVAGNRQMMLQVNPELGHVLGISLRPGAARLALLDAGGSQLGAHQLAIAAPLAAVPAELHTAAADWLASLKPAGRLLGVGAGVAGIVDADHGIVLRSTPFNATEVPLQQLLADRFGVTTLIDHDACFGARAEAMPGGAAADIPNFLYFLINYNADRQKIRFNSYGSALFLEGKVLRGAHYGAGELTAPLEPPPLDASESDLRDLAAPGAALPDSLRPLARALGPILASITNLIDLQAIVLAGTTNIRNKEFIAALRSELDRTLIPVPRRCLQILPASGGPEVVARGAALAAADAALSDPQLWS